MQPGTAMSLAASALLAFWSSGASADGWFLHRFGELRAYHGDWLAVCDAAGAGPCRAVQIRLEGDETRVGPARIAVHRLPGGGHATEIFMRGMAEPGLRDPVIFAIDGVILPVPPDGWAPGEVGVPNVLESFAILGQERNAALVAAMRAGRWLSVSWGDGGGAWGDLASATAGDQTRLSLRGLTAALAAIETQLGEAE